jgi:flagellar basal-body rod protein FlgC
MYTVSSEDSRSLYREADMGLYDGLQISVSGMDAQMRRMRLIASNLANVDSTRSDTGQTYRRKDIVFAAMPLEQGPGVAFNGTEGLRKVTTVGVVEDPRPPRRLHMPGHPDADEQGFVEFPNVKRFEEMVNMMEAFRSYEANLMTFNTSKEMMKRAFDTWR